MPPGALQSLQQPCAAFPPCEREKPQANGLGLIHLFTGDGDGYVLGHGLGLQILPSIPFALRNIRGC